MQILVRSWNLFHGRAVGQDGTVAATGLLAEMVALAARGGPAVVCLQEVPPAALAHLADWSGMDVYAAIAQPPSIGPLPVSATIGQRLTDLAPRALRAAFSGQANALLVRRDLPASEHAELHLNDSAFVRATAEMLGVDPLLRLAWQRERRVAQSLRLRLPDGRTARIVALHATSCPSDPALPDAEVARAAAWLADLSARDDLAILAGDLNVPPAASPTLQRLRAGGFSEAACGIDQVVVRGARALGPPVVWPAEARATAAGLLLSDHAPVEVTIA